MKFHIFLSFSCFFKFEILYTGEMGKRTLDGGVWATFLCPRELARQHALIRDLRMLLFHRDDMVEMTVTQSFVTVLEAIAGAM